MKDSSTSKSTSGSFFKNFIVFKWARSLKTWVESYSNKPNSQVALFIFAFAEAIFFPIPPDVLLIAMGFSVPRKAIRFALVCTMGSLCGAAIGYGIGIFFSDFGKLLINYFDSSGIVVNKIDELFIAYGFGGILIAAITPIPFKVFTIASGLFGYNFGFFLLASLLGRSFRFLIVSGLFYLFGKKIKPFIEKHFELLVILFTILLIGGFFILKYIG